ncbi:MAG: hypothetical protein ACUZ8I_16690 [Candidatus Scalindua sp.]
MNINKKNIKHCLVLLLFVISPLTIFAQDQLSVNIEDPIYSILEICSIRGTLPQISYVKPFNTGTIKEYIKSTLGNRMRLNDYEVAILKNAYDSYLNDDIGLRFFVEEESEIRAAFSSNNYFHSVNMIQGGIIGTLGPSLAYNMNLGVFLDKVDPEAFAPYDFTKKWDGFHVWSVEGKVLYSDGINDHLNFSFNTLPELSLDILDSKGNLKIARMRREWGVGDGSLSLSGTARPIEAITGIIRPNSWSNFHFLTGILGNWQDKLNEQKMFSIHRLELFPFKWLYISPWESVVWAKRMELSYFNPLMSYFMGQQIIGDVDNIALGGDVAVTIVPYIRLYFSLFIDELIISELKGFFQRLNNQYAWQVGFKIPLPSLPFSLLTFQYTKIEPYSYTHYPQELPQYTNPININFSHDGENIGYHLPPNSDEFLIKVSSYPISGLAATVQYQLIRHGTGDHLKGQIEGDINIWLDYGTISDYPPKDFLHDGIYEWINIVKVNISYTFPSLQTTVWGEYSYVNVRNYRNIPGNDVVKNLIGLGIKINTW